jgi:hypothetical protein
MWIVQHAIPETTKNLLSVAGTFQILAPHLHKQLRIVNFSLYFFRKVFNNSM